MTRADEVLAATLNLLGTPVGDESPAACAALTKVHKRAEHSHPVRWACRVVRSWRKAVSG